MSNTIARNNIVFLILPVVAVFLPLTAVLKDNTESLLSLASLSLFAITALLFIVPGIVMAVGNNYIRIPMATLLVVFTAYALYFPVPGQKPEVSWIPFGDYGVLLLVAVAVFFVAWLIRRKLGEILLVILLVLWVSMILTPINAEKESKVIYFNDGAAFNETLPRYIHIFFDQHIGVEGLNSDDNAETAKYKKALISQYVDNGFDVYGRAYSHHNKSMYSFPSFMNFYNGEQPGLFTKEKKFGAKLTQNKLFDLLTKRGYRIHLYQTDYVEMCSPEKYNHYKCETYIMDRLYDESLPYREKIIIVLDELAKRFMIKTIWRKLSVHPEWPNLHADRFSSESLNKIEQLKEDVKNSGRGQAFFSHIMLPHHPYHFDSQCQFTRIVPTIDEDREEQGYYLEQMKCLHKKMKEFILSMKKNGIFEDSTIIIHGDHGSRIIKPQPALDEPPSNRYISWHSTFFAIHEPSGTPSKYHINPISLTELMRSIHDIASPTKGSKDPFVYIMPNGFIPDDYKFKKVPLPPFLDGNVVKSW